MEKVLELELEKSFQFFWSEANTNHGSPGYGLVPDRTNRKDQASIAAVGFALTAYVIGVERGFITYQQGLQRVLGTLKTLKNHVPHYKGFFVHFCDIDTAERFMSCEYSTVDTALVVNGILTVDSYFGQPEIHQLSQSIIERIDWNFFVFVKDTKTYFHMAYNDEADGAYANGEAGFVSAWSMSAEQLMMYIQAAGSKQVDKETAKALYLGFDRTYGEYGGHSCYFEPGGTLFTYQYSHAWFDFKQYKGCDDIDWFENSRQATLAQIAWCQDHKGQYKTFNEGLWGLSAFDSPHGYMVSGAKPALKEPITDGTIGPCVIAGSLPFTYEESLKALNYVYKNHPRLWGEYGFKDSYNGDVVWYASTYLGINKGETLLMIDNALYGTTWKYYMKHPIIQAAIDKLDMIKK